MKYFIDTLNKAFESRIRLGIMSILMVNDQVNFTMLKDLLDITDGNVASHISGLEKLGYLTVTKQFIGKKPNTSYAATESGKAAFAEHVKALEKLLQTKI
ncbi:MAG: winged helix-turn-helix domain-containing protein [Sediminibacterium sp.]